MAEHAMPVTGRPEPVLILDAVKALVVLAVALGWVFLDQVQVELLLTAVGSVVTLVLTFVTRARVTPNSDPETVDGELLVPVGVALEQDPWSDG